VRVLRKVRAWTRCLYNPRKGEGTLETTRNRRLFVVAVALFAVVFVPGAGAQQLPPQLQNAVGHWQTYADGKPNGQMETYLVEGKLFGRVTQVRPGRTPQDVCDKCSGEMKNRTILGLAIMRGFHPDGDEWVGGTVVDPENGKEYQGKIWAVGKDSLHMRGFIGFSIFGRTEVWTRIP
jgi:uncharacterized protein (DUF2147 family)